jgi:hypothetical protein
MITPEDAIRTLETLDEIVARAYEKFARQAVTSGEELQATLLAVSQAAGIQADALGRQLGKMK